MKTLFVVLLLLGLQSVISQASTDVSLEETLTAQTFIKEIKLISKNTFENYATTHQYFLKILEPTGKIIELELLTAERQTKPYLEMLLFRLNQTPNAENFAALGLTTGFAGSLCLGMVDSVSPVLQTAFAKFEAGLIGTSQQQFQDLIVQTKINKDGLELRLLQTGNPHSKTWGSSCKP